jgi:hypothetical protein
MPPKSKKRDVNLDCENVKAYREIIHLQLNYLQRQFVVDKVSCCERGQRIWRSVLTEHMLHGYNPKDVPRIVKLWEGQFFCEPGLRFSQWEPNGNGTH